MPKLLTIRQAAAEINVCRNTLRAMIDDGRVRAKNINPRGKRPTWRVVAESLQEFRDAPLGLRCWRRSCGKRNWRGGWGGE